MNERAAWAPPAEDRSDVSLWINTYRWNMYAYVRIKIEIYTCALGIEKTKKKEKIYNSKHMYKNSRKSKPRERIDIESLIRN